MLYRKGSTLPKHGYSNKDVHLLIYIFSGRENFIFLSLSPFDSYSRTVLLNIATYHHTLLSSVALFLQRTAMELGRKVAGRGSGGDHAHGVRVPSGVQRRHADGAGKHSSWHVIAEVG